MGVKIRAKKQNRQLCAAVFFTFKELVELAITIAIFITSMSISQLYNPDIYNMDAVIELGYDTGKADKFIKGLDEIKDCEYLYQHYINAEVNGKKKALISFAAYGDFKLYTGISGLGEEPEADEVYICEGYAGQLGVKVGDTVEIKDLDSYSTDENGTEEHST